MLKDLTQAQRQLAEYMSHISEQAYSAGWMQHLEYELWSAVQDGPRVYGRVELCDEHLRRLGSLAEGCDGWIVFDENTEETWLSMHDWLKRFSTWDQNRRGSPAT